MLLVHGSAATGTEWLAALPALSQHFTVYIMERRGRAPSGDNAIWSIDREVEDVAAIIAAIGEPVVLVGHSFGALVAVQGMASGGLRDISRVILYEPPAFAGRNPNDTQAREEVEQAWAANDRDRVTELFLATVFSPERACAIRATPAWPALMAIANTLPREMGTAGSFESRSAALKAGLSKWTIPTTMLLGGDSPPYMKEATAFICESLPDCRTVILEGHGHMANVVAPALFVETILKP